MFEMRKIAVWCVFVLMVFLMAGDHWICMIPILLSLVPVVLLSMLVDRLRDM